MSDEPELEPDQLHVEFVAWLCGDTPGDAPDFDVADRPGAWAKSLASRLNDPGLPVVQTLERLSSRVPPNLLEAVLPVIRRPLAIALKNCPLHPPDNPAIATTDGVSGTTVYLVLRLSDPPLSYANRAEMAFLVMASRRDPTMLRHLLAWASTSTPTNPSGMSFKNQPVPTSTWGFVAEAFMWVFAHRTPGARWTDYSLRDWEDGEGADLANAAIGTVDVARLTNAVKTFFASELDGAVELAQLGPNPAMTVAQADGSLSTFADWVLPRMAIDPRLGFIWPDDRIAVALRLLPLGGVEQEPDAPAHTEEKAGSGRWHHDQLNRLRLAVGFAAGAVLHHRELPRTLEAVDQVLRYPIDQPSPPHLAALALLWADLIQLFEYERKSYEHRDQIRGVVARMSKHLIERPEVWALSTEALLGQAAVANSQALDLLTLAAAQSAAVRQALIAATQHPTRATRDLAEGLLARVEGVAHPGEEFRRWLADTAASVFDGVPLFPHPLSPLARTWLGSTEVEEALARSLRRAAARFTDVIVSQGGAQEELLTGMLVSELEAAFRDARLRLELGGRPRLAQTISVSQRPIAKSEEKLWGCDIALLVHADLRPSISLQLAELVQVKKSEALAKNTAPSTTDSWRIDVPQLVRLVNLSESACYWLITAAGDLACVTARWIFGLVAGRDATNQRTVTVGYNDVRHTCVGIDQFLPELVLGTWLGSIDEETLRFASGENSNISPRHILEITVQSTEHERQ